LLITPAAGFRFRETGNLTDVSEVIACWSSSSSFAGGHKASDIWSREESVGPLDLSGRAYGFSVRCVQNLRLLYLSY